MALDHIILQLAILELVNNIYEGFESNEYTSRIFLDRKKLFGTVNHQILIVSVALL